MFFQHWLSIPVSISQSEETQWRHTHCRSSSHGLQFGKGWASIIHELAMNSLASGFHFCLHLPLSGDYPEGNQHSVRAGWLWWQKELLSQLLWQIFPEHWGLSGGRGE